tara:strand:+ start:2145 stop:3137 length:993 start_codon:yes stop_codon:yes gene_type:complete
MTLVYTELLPSRTISRDKGDVSATRTFLVYSAAGTQLLIDDAINSFAGPQIGDEHPDVDGIYAFGYSIEASSKRGSAYEVEFSYKVPVEDTDPGGSEDAFSGGFNTDVEPIPTIEEGSGGSSGGTEEEDDDGITDGTGDFDIAFTGISIVTSTSLQDAWCANPTIPENGTQVINGAGTPTVAGMGTTPALYQATAIVHEGGTPVTAYVPQATITISTQYAGSTFNMSGLHLITGMRNASAFMGLSIGSVLFMGMSVQRSEPSLYDISYEFLWDGWSHMRQSCQRFKDEASVGKPKYIPVGGTVQGIFAAETLPIYILQPTRGLTSFGFAP